MARQISISRDRIPRHHDWYFTNACKGDGLIYLANRRLLETTLFAIPCARAPIAMQAPDTLSFDAPSSSQTAPSGGFVLNGIHSLQHEPTGRTAFRVLLHEGSLYVAVRCEDPAGIAKMPAPDHPLFNGLNISMLPHMSDYVTLFIDPVNGHDASWQFSGTPSGGKLTGKLHYGAGVVGLMHPINPLARAVVVEEQDCGVTDCWELHVRVDEDRHGWTAFFRIPLSLLGVTTEPVIGFNVCRFKQSMPPEQSAWSDLRWHGENFHVPIRLGDLYLGESPVTVQNLWTGEGLAGRTRVAFEAINHNPKPLQTEWQLSSESPSEVVLLPGSNLVELPFDNAGGLHISGRLVGGTAPFFAASYEVSAFRRLGESGAQRPTASDPEYDAAMRRWLASRLPRLMRVTTADGAPSDFCLADADGRVMFNLMKPGVMRQIARMIETRFEDPEDRLAAVEMLVDQPDLYVYELVENFGDLQSTPLSVLRLGTGICGARATIMQGIVEAFRLTGGKRYRAYRGGIMQYRLEDGKLLRSFGHSQLLVLYPDGHQIMLNTFCYRPEDRRLAGPADVETFAKTNTWAYNPDNLMNIDCGSRPWPDGAPPA